MLTKVKKNQAKRYYDLPVLIILRSVLLLLDKSLFFALVFFILTGSKSYLSYISVLNLISIFYEIYYT